MSVVSFRTGAAKYKNLEDSIFVASETVKSLGGGGFRAGLKISKVYSTKTNIALGWASFRLMQMLFFASEGIGKSVRAQSILYG